MELINFSKSYSRVVFFIQQSKLTKQRDKPWAKELSEFLLISELCSLGADFGEFLLKRARTSAKNALEYEDEIRKAAKKRRD